MQVQAVSLRMPPAPGPRNRRRSAHVISTFRLHPRQPRDVASSPRPAPVRIWVVADSIDSAATGTKGIGSRSRQAIKGASEPLQERGRGSFRPFTLAHVCSRSQTLKGPEEASSRESGWLRAPTSRLVLTPRTWMLWLPVARRKVKSLRRMVLPTTAPPKVHGSTKSKMVGQPLLYSCVEGGRIRDEQRRVS